MSDYIQDMSNMAPVVTDDPTAGQSDDDQLPSTAKEMLDLLEADGECDASNEHVEEQYLSAWETEILTALRRNTANMIPPDLPPPSPEINYAKEGPKPVALSSLQASSPSEKNDLALLAKRKQNWPWTVFPVPVRPRDILAYAWSGGVGELEGLGHAQTTAVDARAKSNPGGYYPSNPRGNARPHTYPAGQYHTGTDNGHIVQPDGSTGSHNHNYGHGPGPDNDGYGYGQPSNGPGHPPRNETGVHYLPPRSLGGGGKPPPNQLGGLGGRQDKGYYYYGNAPDVSQHSGGAYYCGNGRANGTGNAANGGPVYGHATQPEVPNMTAGNLHGNGYSYPAGRSFSQSAPGHSYGNGGGPYPGEHGMGSAAPGQADGFERFHNYLLDMWSKQPGTEAAVLKN
ncbi:hypothetical protein PHISP_01959 [Aspergillus sp. HF37]|nr:hypothetical protein PHISP_01959 [Aspergillus sp. HF37]